MGLQRYACFKSRRHQGAIHLISPTLRRHLLDKFLKRVEMNLSPPTLDVGGVRAARRGNWTPPTETAPEWLVLNPDRRTKPDFVLSGEVTPFRQGAFNSILCTEVLEVVANPEWIVQEISRLLSQGGTLVITIPFLNQLHPHPNDYQRWTNKKIEEVLRLNGLKVVSIEPMGSVFAVIYDLILAAMSRAIDSASLESHPVRQMLLRITRRLIRSSSWLWIICDRMAHRLSSWITTGWAVVAKKNG